MTLGNPTKETTSTSCVIRPKAAAVERRVRSAGQPVRPTSHTVAVVQSRPATQDTAVNSSGDQTFVMLHLVSGTNSLYLFVNLILYCLVPFPTNLFLHQSLLPFLIHQVLCSSITPSLFYSRLKTHLFHNPPPCSFTFSSRTAYTDYCPNRFF